MREKQRRWPRARARVKRFEARIRGLNLVTAAPLASRLILYLYVYLFFPPDASWLLLQNHRENTGKNTRIHSRRMSKNPRPGRRLANNEEKRYLNSCDGSSLENLFQ